MIRLSVITRTYDRLPFIQRCLESLRRAAIQDMEWIVVDDKPGGSQALCGFIDAVRQDGQFPILRIVAGTRHRSKAANAGLHAASGSFIHFFDDDDTVNPNFYKQTIGFLDAHSRFGAVASHSERVTERIEPEGTLREVRRIPHYPETSAISLAEFAVVQSFAPVAFVARRECIDATGLFDTSLDVCEDYDFYLRFLERFDIGVLPEKLCAFHQREGDLPAESWRNSAASIQHELEDKLFRNTLLRRDLQAGKLGLGWLLAVGTLNRAGWRANLALDALQRNSLINFFLRRLRRD